MESLKQLRERINKTDADIIKKLAMRQRLIIRIGQLKAQSGKPVLNPKREAKLMKYYESLCEQYQLDPMFVKRLFNMVFAHSRKIQRLR